VEIAVYNVNKPVKSAKFSKNQLYIAVAFDDGSIHILNGAAPFLTYNRSVTTGWTTTINELDFNWNND
jgi:hypothetical protein